MSGLPNTDQLQQSFLKCVEKASGKPVLVQCDPNFSNHATIRIARHDQPAHLFQYKPEHEATLPYLTAFQCLFALRTIEAAPESRFDLASKSNLIPDVLKLVQDHTRNSGSVPCHALEKLAQQFGHGLGFQLRSMPLAIRIDQEIFDGYPDLRPFQRRNVEQQLQECNHALSPQIKEIAPPTIITANASMSAAFAMFWSGQWSEPAIALPYVSAGYRQVGDDLLVLTKRIPSDPNHDRQLVDAWIERLGLHGWFHTVAR